MTPAKGERPARRDAPKRDEHARLAERVAHLEIERDAARAANHARSRFFAQLSHELRTPLDAVIGLTDSVLRGGLEDAQHDRLVQVLLAGETLLGVVNDLLDFARIEADEGALERVPFDLHDAVFDTLSAVAPAARARGLDVVCGIDPRLPSLVIGDPGRLRHVLAVLLRNAVRFTERGEVLVRVGMRARDEEILLDLEVRDSGVGIDPERLVDLFDPPDRTTDAPVLGLPLCRKLVERMGGSLRAQSVPGAGSTFSFSARVEVTEGVCDRHRRAAKPLSGLRVLIADAHAESARILEEQTRAWGMLPEVVSSTKDGLVLLSEAHTAGDGIPLLYVDARLPEGGLEWIGQLRGDPRFEALAVIVLHDASRPASPELARRLAIASQLPKPAHPGRLFEAAVEALGVPQPPTPPHYRYRSTRDSLRLSHRPPLAAGAPAWIPPSRILAVDDSRGGLEVLASILGDQGHTIETADGGRSALERFQAGRFDVVLLDLQMPGMDGFEVCAAMRAREAGSGFRAPIVAMTANALRGDRERCLLAGMDQFVTKPVRRAELFAALLEVLGSAEPHAGSDPEPEDPARIDWSAMVEMVDGNRELLREVVTAYVVEIREHLERLPIELAAGDGVEARRRSHSLRGALGAFGATAAEEIAGRLEQRTAAGEFDAATTLFEHLRTAIAKVLNQLEAHLRGEDPESVREP